MNRQKGLVEKKCSECGKMFSPWRSFQVFCTKSCGQVRHMANYWKRKLKSESPTGIGPEEARP